MAARQCGIGGQSMNGIDYGKMGMRIRQVREAKGLSREALAKQCGISLAFLGHIERGKRSMSLETFANLCSALGAKADELLWGIPQMSEAAARDMWGHPGKAEKDSYAMYVRIMKSVADIMGKP